MTTDSEWQRLTVPLRTVATAMQCGVSYQWSEQRREALTEAVKAAGELQRRYEAMEAELAALKQGEGGGGD